LLDTSQKKLTFSYSRCSALLPLALTQPLMSSKFWAVVLLKRETLVLLKREIQLSKNRSKPRPNKLLQLKKKRLAVARRKKQIARGKKKKKIAYSKKNKNVLNLNECVSKRNNFKKTSKILKCSVWRMRSAFSSKSCATTKKRSNKMTTMMRQVPNLLLKTVQLSKKMALVEPWLKKLVVLWLTLMMKSFLLMTQVKVKEKERAPKSRWAALARKRRRELLQQEQLRLVPVKAIARN